MSLAANFYRAARPEPPRCIGLQLKPYSLGHHITLMSYDSSFARGMSPHFDDLILSVLVCSMSWSEWNEWRRSWKLPIFLKVWGWLMGKFDLRSAAKTFSEYISEGCACPEVAVPASGKSLCAAWESRLKLFLVKELRLTHEQAMDYPLSLAWHEYSAHGELEGTLTLLSDADIATQDFLGSEEMQRLVQEANESGKREVEEMKKKVYEQPTGAN